MNRAQKKRAIFKLKYKLLRNTARAAKVMVVYLNAENPSNRRTKALLLFLRVSLRVRMDINRLHIIAAQPLQPFPSGGHTVEAKMIKGDPPSARDLMTNMDADKSDLHERMEIMVELRQLLSNENQEGEI